VTGSATSFLSQVATKFKFSIQERGKERWGKERGRERRGKKRRKK